uniref:Uncharacterized protein n=1 Tax=Solanum lycopersicum TaxID=4081 RepID=A0A3Q7FUC7_SOLLC
MFSLDLKAVDWHGSSGGYMRFWKKFQFMVHLLRLLRLTEACSHDRPMLAAILGVKAFELIMFEYRKVQFFCR